MNIIHQQSGQSYILPPLETRKKRCSKCCQNLSLEEFSTYICRSRGLRRRSRCKKCELDRVRNYNSLHRERKRIGYRKVKVKKFLTGGDILLRYIFNQRLGQYRKTTKKHNLPKLDISADFLVNLYHKQKGLCYYTGKSMVWGHQLKVQQPDSMSLDRVDPLKGYTRDNVVLCTYEVNTMKGPHNIKEFKEIIQTINNYITFL